MASTKSPLAFVTGASTGIGHELARCCAEEGFDLLIAADESKIEEAGNRLRAMGVEVAVVEADLSTFEGVDNILPAGVTAEMHRSMAAPGSAKR